jgi:hypothetical protein
MEAGATPLGGLDGALRAFARRAGARREGCMGVTAVFEFGQSDPDVTALTEASGRTQLAALERQLRAAANAGEVAPDLDVPAAAAFVAASQAGMRVAARSGIDAQALERIAAFTVRAFRDTV